MSFCNMDIANRNIRMLMKNRNTTQAELAAFLGMSQPNFSRALSENDKKNFTLDQIVGIANYYKISVDKLIGNTVSERAQVSPRAIARFVSKLLENHRAILKEITVNEDRYYYDWNPAEGITHKVVDANYLAVYFPNYMPLPESTGPDVDDLIAEYVQCGNQTDFGSLNRFLHDFPVILKNHEMQVLSDGVYNTVLTEMLNELSDR